VTLLAVADKPQVEEDVRVIPVPRSQGRISRALLGVPRALSNAWRLNADVYHLHDPELIPLIPLLRLRGARVVYDAHEDLPVQVLDKHYLHPLLKGGVALASRALCRAARHTSSHVVAATPTIAKRFSPGSTTIVHNYPEILPDVDAVEPYAERERIVVYSGGLSVQRGAFQIVDAMQQADLPGWRLLMVGPHNPRSLTAQLRTRPGWQRVDDRGVVSPLDARRITAAARIGLVLSQPSRAQRDALPTKLFEYMVAGVPVVASNFPLWASIVGGANCGLLVDPTDPTAIAAAMEELASNPERAADMGRRGRQAVLSRLNWTREERLLLSLYQRLLGLP
jgi:glycosyltransferase involved in cell wall biosynthesis